MKFAFIAKADYHIGQVIYVAGHGKMRVESYSHTGENVVVRTLDSAERFERVMCICTDEPPIEEVTL